MSLQNDIIKIYAKLYAFRLPVPVAGKNNQLKKVFTQHFLACLLLCAMCILYSPPVHVMVSCDFHVMVSCDFHVMVSCDFHVIVSCDFHVMVLFSYARCLCQGEVFSLVMGERRVYCKVMHLYHNKTAILVGTTSESLNMYLIVSDCF